jgi:Rne/Rng family ribonuclease
MDKQIIVDHKLTLLRVGIVEEGKLTALYTNSLFEQSLQNKIIQGQITDVVKHLKAVFVDFGGDKKGLLHIQQIPACYQNKIQIGLRLPVKVIKESVGDKGAKLTALIDLQGEYAICLPYESGVGISKKIKDNEQRERLKAFVEELYGEFGWIIRTQAEKASLEEMKEELEALSAIGKKLKVMGENVSKGTLLYEEPFYLQMIKEHVRRQESIVFHCNEEQVTHSLEQLAKQLNLKVQIKQYGVEKNIIHDLGFQKAYDEALKRKIWLKNGGNLVIEQTEAMTVIDVNSAKANAKKNQDKAIQELNQLAFKEVLNQIYLRDLGGIILVDLVDFKSETEKPLFEAYAKELIREKQDETLKIYPLTDLCLLQITRSKKRIPLHEKVFEPTQEYEKKHRLSYQVFELEEALQKIKDTTIYNKIYLLTNQKLKQFILQKDLIQLFRERYDIMVEIVEESGMEGFKIAYYK